MTLAREFKQTPWWWEDRSAAAATPNDSIPRKADVVIIGAGVTGLEAARALVTGGRHVVICEAGNVGEGASSRNAGQIGRNFKHTYSKLKKERGADEARAVFGELQDAYDAVEALGKQYGDRIGWRTCGRVIGAMSEELAAKLHTEYELRALDLGEHLDILSRDEIRGEMQSDLYHGGVRLPQNGMIQPAKYSQVLEERARKAGATILPGTPVISVASDPPGFEVTTSRGAIAARNVVVATNGYSGKAVPAIQKRLLPITSYMIATEQLSPNKVATILSGARTYHDNRRRSHYFTVADNGRRILMGGRTGTIHRSERGTLEKLAQDLHFIFPELEGVSITHGWSGRCSAPMDLFPRFGELGGMHYVLGYSFSGMAMGPHLARKVAECILHPGRDVQSHFARPHFNPFPPFTRTLLSTAIVTQWYAEADRPKGMNRRL